MQHLIDQVLFNYLKSEAATTSSVDSQSSYLWYVFREYTQAGTCVQSKQGYPFINYSRPVNCSCQIYSYISCYSLSSKLSSILSQSLNRYYSVLHTKNIECEQHILKPTSLMFHQFWWRCELKYHVFKLASITLHVFEIKLVMTL